MPETIPNLWPEQFKVDVQTPLTILRVQANYLAKVTRGILEGTVETGSNREAVQHRLVVIAPAYNGYRRTLITAIHSPDLPYPATIQAEALANRETGNYPRANDDVEMQKLVQQALSAGQTRAVILSLIAKSNEASLPIAVPPAGDLSPREDGAS